MQPELAHLSEQGLRADFNKKQRVYFDRLMSELKQLSGGFTETIENMMYEKMGDPNS